MERKQEKRATALMFLASFLWGSSFVASKICLNEGMLPFETVFYRMLFGVIGMYVIFHRELCHFSPSALSAGLTAGVVTSMIYTTEMYGITMIETTKASFLTSTNIVMMPFLSAIFLRTRLEVRSFLAAMITVCGVALLSLNGTEKMSFSPGDALLLLAALGYAMNSIVVVKLGNGASSTQITFLQLLVTMIYTGIMTLFQGRGGPYSSSAVGALLYLTIGPTLICFLIKNKALQYLSPIRCTIILATEGVFCSILSVMILHDRVTLRVIGGIILILLGIVVESCSCRTHSMGYPENCSH